MKKTLLKEILTWFFERHPGIDQAEQSILALSLSVEEIEKVICETTELFSFENGIVGEGHNSMKLAQAIHKAMKEKI